MIINDETYNNEKSKWENSIHNTPVSIVGSTNGVIDWNRVIDSIKDQTGALSPKLDWDNPRSVSMLRMIQDSGYNKYSIGWQNYYSGSHYNDEIDLQFGELVKHPRCARAWISRIDPGKTAPWHWDLDDNESEYLSEGKLVRFSCSMSAPAEAQFTIIGNKMIYNSPQGTIYQWSDYRLWHGSANAGLSSKYQYNYLGYA